jgi:hypothetical protein
MASRCPYCIDRDQSIWGRLFLVLLLIIGLIIGAKYYSNSKKGDVKHRELIELLNNYGIN